MKTLILFFLIPYAFAQPTRPGGEVVAYPKAMEAALIASNDYVSFLKKKEEHCPRLAGSSLKKVKDLGELYTKLATTRIGYIQAGKCKMFAEHMRCLHNDKDPSLKTIKHFLGTREMIVTLQRQNPGLSPDEAKKMIDFFRSIENPCAEKDACEM